MPIVVYDSVGLTYSYTRGHAKYLQLARKLSSRFFFVFLNEVIFFFCVVEGVKGLF